jgi:hypothetical protein
MIIDPPAPSPSDPSTLGQLKGLRTGDPLGQAIAQEHGFFLKRILSDEITRMLFSTKIFSRSKMVQGVRDVITDESFVRVAGRNDVSLLHPIDLELGSSNRLGIADDVSMIRKAIERHRPLDFATAPAQAGAAAIFTYMKHMKGYGIDICYDFAHSPEIAKRIIERSFSRPPDACVLGSAATATVLANSRPLEYSPLMMMPKISHRVVAPTRDNSGGFEGHYVAISDNPSTTRFYYEKLIRFGLIPGASSIEHVDPDETTVLLSEGDPDLRATMWFPCYRFNQEWNNCTVLDNDDITRGDQATFLFVRNELLSDAAFVFALSVAIRDAWITLMTSQKLVWAVVDEMLRDDRYVSVLIRVTGAHNILAKQASLGQSPWQLKPSSQGQLHDQPPSFLLAPETVSIAAATTPMIGTQLPAPGTRKIIIFHSGNNYAMEADGIRFAFEGTENFILERFAKQIVAGLPNEVIGFRELHDLIDDVGVEPGKASDRLRKIVDTLNRRIADKLGAPPLGHRYIEATRRQGYHLGGWLSWQISKALASELRVRFELTSDPHEMAERDADHGTKVQTQSNRGRRRKPEND